jgi:hypothetical protein
VSVSLPDARWRYRLAMASSYLALKGSDVNASTQHRS